MESRRITPLKELPLSNDYMFGEVMRQERVCKLFLEALLGKEIQKIKFIEKQEDLSDSYLNHGVRLDIYLNDEVGTLYNIEMQAIHKDAIEKRIRYYQGAMDRKALEKGIPYVALPDSYVIFVCNFDYFQAGLAVYERESYIKDAPELAYQDGSHVLILNSAYTTGNADEAILEFLSFLRTNDIETLFQTSLMKEVKEAVETVRNDKGREMAYMTVAMKMDDIRRRSLDEGREAGIIEGIVKGRAEGIAIGEEKGMEKERENSIVTLIQTVKELVSDQPLVVKKLMERYHLSRADAEEKVKRYW